MSDLGIGFLTKLCLFPAILICTHLITFSPFRFFIESLNLNLGAFGVLLQICFVLCSNSNSDILSASRSFCLLNF